MSSVPVTREQVIAQCKAVAHMAFALAAVYEDYGSIFEAGAGEQILTMVGRRTAVQMETLGDMLNGMDAHDESDAWLDAVFEKMHEMFPEAKS
jgi:hypothetical protein